MEINLGKKNIILGVDPGTVVTGYALIQIENKKLKLLTLGAMLLAKQGLSHGQKLHKVYMRISNLIHEFNANLLSIESPFYGKNIQATLKLGRMQGIVIAAALAHNLEYFEYTPREVKKAICGYGNASKAQVAGVLANLFPEAQVQYGDSFLDAYDALACAVCHYYRISTSLDSPTIIQKLSKTTKGTKSNTTKKWEQFIQNNPHRIRSDNN